MAGDMEIKPVVSTTSYRPTTYPGSSRAEVGREPARRTADKVGPEPAPKLDVPLTYARFVVRDGEVMIQVVDRASEEVIREIPPEEVLKMAAELRAYQQALEAHRRRADILHTGKVGER